MGPEDIRKAVLDIARLTLQKIDPDAHYLVMAGEGVNEFVSDRLLNNEQVNMVGHRDNPVGLPVRPYGIYRLTEEGEGHLEIHHAWGPHFEQLGLGLIMDGADITVGMAIHDAEITVAALVETLPPHLRPPDAEPTETT